MSGEVMKLVMSQGAWAALFVYLLFYTLKKQEKRDEKQEERETKYQDIISKLTEKFECIENGICEIKDEIKTLKK